MAVAVIVKAVALDLAVVPAVAPAADLAVGAASGSSAEAALLFWSASALAPPPAGRAHPLLEPAKV